MTAGRADALRLGACKPPRQRVGAAAMLKAPPCTLPMRSAPPGRTRTSAASRPERQGCRQCVICGVPMPSLCRRPRSRRTGGRRAPQKQGGARRHAPLMSSPQENGRPRQGRKRSVVCPIGIRTLSFSSRKNNRLHAEADEAPCRHAERKCGVAPHRRLSRRGMGSRPAVGRRGRHAIGFREGWRRSSASGPCPACHDCAASPARLPRAAGRRPSPVCP